MKWFLFILPDWLLIAVSYVVVPFIVSFCDKHGELHGFLRNFQTWDDSCDSSFCVKEVVPSFLRYNWDSKFIEFEDVDPELNRRRIYTKKRLFARFTFWESVQRYCCRVIWLWRNPAYGFGIRLFGVKANSLFYRRIIDKPDQFLIIEKGVAGRSLWNTPWQYKDSRRLCKWLRLSINIGWKLSDTQGESVSCMMANRIAVRFGGD